MKVVIDRFEGEFVVCQSEDGQILNIEKSRVPEEAREGDVLSIIGHNIIVDREETEKRRSKVLKLMDETWE